MDKVIETKSQMIMRIADLSEALKRLEQENEELKADIISRTMCITCERELQNSNLQAENERLKARLRPLEDSYFKGLSSIEIAELAKKSIRIMAENRKLEQALPEQTYQMNNLNKK